MRHVRTRIARLSIVLAMGMLASPTLGNPGNPAASSALATPAKRLAQWIGLMILQGMTYDAIKKTVKKEIPSLTERDVEFALNAGLRELAKARSDPRPSVADCQTALYRAVNPNCD